MKRAHSFIQTPDGGHPLDCPECVAEHKRRETRRKVQALSEDAEALRLAGEMVVKAWDDGRLESGDAWQEIEDLRAAVSR